MKKVLIITYYFPPAGGPGVQRWLKFIKYLPEFDVEPIVYVPENPTYPIIDTQLAEEIPAHVKIIKKPIFEPYRLASVFSKAKTKKMSSGIIASKRRQTSIDQFLLWIRGNFFIPDARILWVKPSVAYLEKYLAENHIDTIITSGPPHSLHLIGLGLKQKTGINWIADFRDPWTSIGYHKSLKLSTYSERRHKLLEKEVLNTADAVIVTSNFTKAEFSAITPKPIEVITNGYDFEKVPKQPLDEKFTFAHIGSFLSERNPKILWSSLAELVKENEAFARHFELKLIGTVSQEILDMLHAYNLDEYVNLVGYVSHQQAILHQKKSQLLLLIEINSVDTMSIIPGKLFEYMVSERPIIAIGPRGSEFADILTETNSGVFFDYDDKAKLKAALLKYFGQYANGSLQSHPVGLQQYSRKNLTQKLAGLIHKI